jgi:hypothetical protein
MILALDGLRKADWTLISTLKRDTGYDKRVVEKYESVIAARCGSKYSTTRQRVILERPI